MIERRYTVVNGLQSARSHPIISGAQLFHVRVPEVVNEFAPAAFQKRRVD